MADYADTFTGGLNSNLGAGWEVDFNQSPTTNDGWEIDGSNYAFMDGEPGGSLQRYARYETTVGVDGWAEITVGSFFASGSSQLGVCYRAPNSGDSMNSYMVMYDHLNGSGALRIRETSGGVSPSRLYLGSGVAYTPVGGDRIAIEVSTNGSSQPVIKSFVNDVEQESYTDTALTHTTGGRAGLFCYTAGSLGQPMRLSEFNTGDGSYLDSDAVIAFDTLTPVTLVAPAIVGGSGPSIQMQPVNVAAMPSPTITPGPTLIDMDPVESGTIPAPRLIDSAVAIVVADSISPSEAATNWFDSVVALGYQATYVLDSEAASTGYVGVVITPEADPTVALAKYFPDTLGAPPVIVANPFLWDDWGMTDGTAHTVFNTVSGLYFNNNYLNWDAGEGGDFNNDVFTDSNEAVAYMETANLTITSALYDVMLMNIFQTARKLIWFYPTGTTGLNSTLTAPVIGFGVFNTSDPLDINAAGLGLMEDTLSAILDPVTAIPVAPYSVGFASLAIVESESVAVAAGTGVIINVDPATATVSAPDADTLSNNNVLVDAGSATVSAEAITVVAGQDVNIAVAPDKPTAYDDSNTIYGDPTLLYDGGRALVIVAASNVTVSFDGSTIVVTVDPGEVTASAPDVTVTANRSVSISVDPGSGTATAPNATITGDANVVVDPSVITTVGGNVGITAGGTITILVEAGIVTTSASDITLAVGGSVSVPVDAANVSATAPDVTQTGQVPITIAVPIGFSAVSSVGVTVSGDAQIVVDAVSIGAAAPDVVVVTNSLLTVAPGTAIVSAEAVAVTGDVNVAVDAANVETSAPAVSVFTSDTVSLSVDSGAITVSTEPFSVIPQDSLAPQIIKQVITGVPSPSVVATTQDLGVPAPVGDILVAFLVSDEDMGTVTPPAGWTELVAKFDNGDNSVTQASYWRSVNQNEPTTYDWAWTIAQGMAITLVQIRGADIADLIDATSTSTTSGTTHTSPNLTTLTEDTLILRSLGVSEVASITSPLSTVELVNYNSSAGAGNVSTAVVCEDIVNTEAIDTRDFTTSVSAEGTLITIALRPVTVVPVDVTIDPAMITASAADIVVTGNVVVTVAASSVPTAGLDVSVTSDAEIVVDAGEATATGSDSTLSLGAYVVVEAVSVSVSSDGVVVSTNVNVSVDAASIAAAASLIGVDAGRVVIIPVDAASVVASGLDVLAGQPDIHVDVANVVVGGEVGVVVTSVNDKSTYRSGWVNIRSEQGSRLRRRFAFTNTDGTEFDLTDYGVFMVVTHGGRRNQETLSLYEGNGLSVTGNGVYLDLPSTTTAIIDDDGKYRLVAVSSYGKRELLLRGKFLVRANAGR